MPDGWHLGNLIASLFGSENNFSKALECFERSLAIRQRIWGNEHPAVVHNLNNIGETYYLMGASAKADSMLSKIEKSLSSLARNYHEQARYIMESTGLYETNKTEWARTLFGIAQTMEERNDSEREAKRSRLAQALTEYQQSEGDDHPDVGYCYYAIGQTFGNQPEALENYNKALSIWHEAYGKYHRIIADCYERMANYHKAHNDWTSYIECMEHCHDVCKNIYEDTNPQKKHSYRNMNNALVTAICMAHGRDLQNYVQKHIDLMKVMAVTAHVSFNKPEGMEEEYFVLEMENWNVESPVPYEVISYRMQDSLLHITVLKDSVIESFEFYYTFDHNVTFFGKHPNSSGVFFQLQYVGAEKKQHIIDAYHNYSEKMLLDKLKEVKKRPGEEIKQEMKKYGLYDE